MTLNPAARITAYTALAGGALAAATGTVEAQVRVTNLDPDVTITGDDESYDIDLNGDSTTELTIVRMTTTSSDVQLFMAGIYREAASVQPVGRIETIKVVTASSTTSTSGGVLNALAGNTPVGPDAAFVADTTTSAFLLWGKIVNQTVGDWGGVTNKYLGIKFNIDGRTHYGWVRLSVDKTANITVHAYAYNQTPDQPLLTNP